MYTRSESGSSWPVLCALVCLCFCVLIQMLGVPVTLLNPAGSVDQMEPSAQEGFSILPQIPDLHSADPDTTLMEVSSVLHTAMIAAALFHPPVH